MNRQANLWMIIVAGIVGGLWLLFALVTDAAEVVREEGWSRLPADPTFQHKVGELMVAVPLFLAALYGTFRPAGWVSYFIGWAWPITIFGGFLNFLAWLGTAERAPWSEPNRIWFMALLLAGLIGPPLIRAVLSRRRTQFQRFG